MGIKSKIKKLFAQKEYLPVIKTTSSIKEFEGKVALISGGGGGIGLKIAEVIQQLGCDVVIAGTNEEKLNKIKVATGIDAIVMDYRNPESFDSVIDRVVSRHGSLDIFISSVGVHTENVDFWNMTSGEYDRVMNINLKGTFFACQTVGKYMRNNGIKGSILLISSSRGSEPAWSPYGISKWGINGFTKGLGKMLISYGINVNAIAPGATATNLLGYKDGDSITSEENGMNRFVMPDEIAELAKYLVSDAAKMINGEIIHISAGRGTFDIR